MAFTKVCSEQILKHVRTRNAILEAIRICKNKNVLKEYLESREREVMDIMMVLYDEQEIMRSYIESEIYEGTQKAVKEAAKKAAKEATQEATKKTKIKTANRFLNMGKFTIENLLFHAYFWKI